MKEYTFGSIDKRQFLIRLYSHGLYGGFSRYFSKYGYALDLGATKGLNHRCYCPTGRSISGRVCVAGFGMTFWYSSYDGEVPCTCDQVMEELGHEVDRNMED